MATVRWTDGAGDGNWSNTANWDTGILPANSNDIIIATGSNAITAVATGITPASLTVSEGFKGSSIGDGSGLTFGNTTLISITASPNVQLINIGSTGTITTLDVGGMPAGKILVSSGIVSLLRHGNRGLVEFAQGVTVTAIEGGGYGARLLLGNKGAGSDVTSMDWGRGGFAETRRNITNGNCDGGLDFIGTGAPAVSGTLLVTSSGRVRYRAKPPSGSDAIGTLKVLAGGEFTPDGAAESFTIGTAKIHRDAKYTRQAGTVKITESTLVYIGGAGLSAAAAA